MRAGAGIGIVLGCLLVANLLVCPLLLESEGYIGCGFAEMFAFIVGGILATLIQPFYAVPNGILAVLAGFAGLFPISILINRFLYPIDTASLAEGAFILVPAGLLGVAVGRVVSIQRRNRPKPRP
jgi:hypothetical protein